MLFLLEQTFSRSGHALFFQFGRSLLLRLCVCACVFVCVRLNVRTFVFVNA